MSAVQLRRQTYTSLHLIAETESSMHMRQTSLMIMQNVDQIFFALYSALDGATYAMDSIFSFASITRAHTNSVPIAAAKLPV